MRYAMSRSSSKRSHRAGNRTHGRNFAVAYRGGYRV